MVVQQLFIAKKTFEVWKFVISLSMQQNLKESKGLLC
jgi:hypothetical protein